MNLHIIISIGAGAVVLAITYAIANVLIIDKLILKVILAVVLGFISGIIVYIVYPKTTCTDDTTCNGYACSSTGECYTSCTTTDQCAEGTACDNGTCSGTPCTSGQFSSSGYSCNTSTGTYFSTCDSSTPCDTASGYQCNKGNCEMPPCNVNSDCKDTALPVCDNGTCVECLLDTDCSGNTPYCNQTSQTCVECITTSECKSGNSCISGSCMQCSGIGSQPACDMINGTLECNSDCCSDFENININANNTLEIQNNLCINQYINSPQESCSSDTCQSECKNGSGNCVLTWTPYWIASTDGSQFAGININATQTPISISQPWQMIGWPSGNSKQTTDCGGNVFSDPAYTNTLVPGLASYVNQIILIPTNFDTKIKPIPTVQNNDASQVTPTWFYIYDISSNCVLTTDLNIKNGITYCENVSGSSSDCYNYLYNSILLWIPVGSFTQTWFSENALIFGFETAGSNNNNYVTLGDSIYILLNTVYKSQLYYMKLGTAGIQTSSCASQYCNNIFAYDPDGRHDYSSDGDGCDDVDKGNIRIFDSKKLNLHLCFHCF